MAVEYTEIIDRTAYRDAGIIFAPTPQRKVRMEASEEPRARRAAIRWEHERRELVEGIGMHVKDSVLHNHKAEPTKRVSGIIAMENGADQAMPQASKQEVTEFMESQEKDQVEEHIIVPFEVLAGIEAPEEDEDVKDLLWPVEHAQVLGDVSLEAMYEASNGHAGKTYPTFGAPTHFDQEQ